MAAFGLGLSACATLGSSEPPPSRVPMQSFIGRGSTEEAARQDLHRKVEATTLSLLFSMESSLHTRPGDELITLTATKIADSAAGGASVSASQARYPVSDYITAVRQELMWLEEGPLEPETEAFLTPHAVEAAHPKPVGL